ncbi:MAG: helix-turn-helix domain-containing protein, partial [Lachnospiraceae bacterium]|nr:helix-turn-helix domain-containing protein [Lachnospiraceae bacterium]
LDHASRDVYYKDLVNQPLLDLLDYDREHSSSLSHTLEQYIKNKFNVTHTAAALYLNRSTVLAHLKKIEELTSLNLDDWHTHLHLLLSFALLENE